MNVINDAPVREATRHPPTHAATPGRRRHTVVVHGWNKHAVQPQTHPTPDSDDPPPPSRSRWHSSLDYAEVVVAAVAAAAFVAYGSTGTFTTCVAVGAAHLVTRYDWRALFRRLRGSWRSWRKPGKHRASRHRQRFCSA
jgi:hypothetical protein